MTPNRLKADADKALNAGYVRGLWEVHTLLLRQRLWLVALLSWLLICFTLAATDNPVHLSPVAATLALLVAIGFIALR